jgi:hypothetical protein
LNARFHLFLFSLLLVVHAIASLPDAGKILDAVLYVAK